ncbi:solute carrier family 25 member 35-like [Thrips palmi]|uniref:Solute carrier family 25 member 35-like n=1 Tax=Thrips palmi TaxID=161013 RepID=A0A6P8YRC0_THRPL|nr:solute carrier family 25 member 35-like [Thrips palmi]XP_034242562.1 solute carrier family 25 member 35-like [Thrips palmi]XP_034242563.1 solute carrier family 25 member 35-like [Thrips palmi]XP_034242564.1 solute carrier family 25 member 35-like [Thrips palmi]
MEFVLGACASVGAGIFSNPLDVLKTKAQLQGELRARGQYSVHYKNMVHAAYMITKEEGIFALQKGLAPALLHQVGLNGTRLGLFQLAQDAGLNRNEDGSLSAVRTMLISACAGSLGAFFGSPFFLVKTQIQSQAPVAIAKGSNVVLGVQHQHKGMIHAFSTILQKRGPLGVFDGASGAVLRVAVGSTAQLSTFSYSMEYIENNQFFSEDAVWSKAFASSMLVGVVTALTMTPFDTVSTRLFNQTRDASGRGLLYSGIFDCFAKTLKAEGVRGLYKGLIPVYSRIAPHSMLNLMFWEKLKYLHQKFIDQPT